MRDVSCVILCGGRSSRMGRDKAFLPFGRSDLAHFLYDKCQVEFPESYLCFKNAVCIDVPMISESTSMLPIPRIIESSALDSMNANKSWQSESKDMYAPLYGIMCAFVNLTSPYIAFVSVDTPFVDIQDMRRLYDMVSHSRAKGGYITQIDCDGRCVREHFLLSVWHRDCAREIRRAIEARAFRLRDIVSELGFVSLGVCDDNLAYNLNTPQDYAVVLEHLGAL